MRLRPAPPPNPDPRNPRPANAPRVWQTLPKLGHRSPDVRVSSMRTNNHDSYTGAPSLPSMVQEDSGRAFGVKTQEQKGARQGPSKGEMDGTRVGRVRAWTRKYAAQDALGLGQPLPFHWGLRMGTGFAQIGHESSLCTKPTHTNTRARHTKTYPYALTYMVVRACTHTYVHTHTYTYIHIYTKTW